MKRRSFLVIAIILIVMMTIAIVILMLTPKIYEVNTQENSTNSQSILSSVSANSASEEFPAEEWGSGIVYDGSAPIIRNMGEKLSITAIPPRKQGDKPPMSTEVFATWEGEMCFTVNSAEIFNTIEETELNYDDFIDDFSAYDETFKPMVLKLTIENINAKSLFDPSEFFSDCYLLSSKEEFSAEKFRTHDENDWRVASGMPLVYVDPHSDGSTDYFHYKINEGESVEMTMCYYVKIDDVPLDELYLEVKTSSIDHRFGIRLDKLGRAE